MKTPDAPAWPVGQAVPAIPVGQAVPAIPVGQAAPAIFVLFLVLWAGSAAAQDAPRLPPEGSEIRDNSGDEIRTVDGAWQSAVDLRQR